MTKTKRRNNPIRLCITGQKFSVAHKKLGKPILENAGVCKETNI